MQRTQSRGQLRLTRILDRDWPDTTDHRARNKAHGPGLLEAGELHRGLRFGILHEGIPDLNLFRARLAALTEAPAENLQIGSAAQCALFNAAYFTFRNRVQRESKSYHSLVPML